MKIVIVAAKIFPTSTPRAIRATELAKQLAKMGHDVSLYAVLDGYDYSEFEATYKLHVKPIKTRFYVSKKKSFVRKIFDRITLFMFHYLFEYPNIELMFQVKKAICQERDVDYLITIAYPHPIHWGAERAKKKMGTGFPAFWASDCGDPFWGDPIKKHPFYFKQIERKWSIATDAIVVPIPSAKNAYLPEAQSKINVIPQGFDFSDVVIKKGSTDNPYPIFAYSGVIYPGQRDPSSFLDYLSTLDKKFKIVIYTQQNQFYSKYIELLGEKIELRQYVPRTRLIYELSCMDFLINLTNPSSVQSPSKLIDYYLTGRPIIDVSTPFSEHDLINDALNGVFHENKYSSIDMEQYNIVNVAKQFVELAK